MNSNYALVSVLAGAVILSASQSAWGRSDDSGTAKAALTTAEGESDNAAADNADGKTPYSAIISRNVFHLNPIPPPPPPATNDAAAANGPLKLTGFIRSPGEPIRALFVSLAKEATNTAFFNLSEGERDGVLELVKINETQESAEVIHAGNRMTVLLKDSLPTPPGPGGAPGRPGGPPVMPGGVHPPIAAAPAVAQQPQPANYGGGVMVGGATPIAPVNNPTGVGLAGGGTVIPTRTIRANNTPDAGGYQPQSRDESAALMLLDAQAHQAEIANGKYPPPPPIPGASGGDESGASGPPAIPTVPTRPRFR